MYPLNSDFPFHIFIDTKLATVTIRSEEEFFTEDIVILRFDNILSLYWMVIQFYFMPYRTVYKYADIDLDPPSLARILALKKLLNQSRFKLAPITWREIASMIYHHGVKQTQSDLKQWYNEDAHYDRETL